MNKLILLILFSLSYCNSVIGQDSHIHFIEKPDSQKISIYIDQTLFTEFLYSDTLYKQVLYPIYTASGTEITRGYPADERTDHPHQMGLWFSFGDINGLDFWNNSNRIPLDKKEHYGIIRFTGIKNINEKENQFTVEANWTNHNGYILLKEKTTYAFTGKPHERGIQRTTTLTAFNDSIFITENKEGLLGMRLDRNLEADISGIYQNKEGDTGNDVWGKRSAWVVLNGKIKDEKISIAIIDHPENPNYPGWSHAREYGLFAINNLGGRCFDKQAEKVQILLKKEDSITFTHQILIKDGDYLSNQEIENISVVQKSYKKLKAVSRQLC